MHTLFAFLVVPVLLMASFASANGTHPFSVHDMLAMDRISDPQVSPDDGRIVFVLRTTDLDANRGRTDLWLVDVDGDNLRRLTAHPDNDWNPRWSPDGRSIFFLSSRSDKAQVWRIPVDGGEAVQVSKQPLDVSALAVSPDGKSLAISMEVFPDAKTIQDTVDRLKEREERKASGRVFDRLFIRHWDTWKDGRRAHLFVLPVEGGDAIDVMKGMDAGCPIKPFGGPEDFVFTPDSQGVVFVARDAGRAEPWSTNFDLYKVPIDGLQRPKSLTDENEAWDANPVFSPGGKRLAFLSMVRPRYEADRFRIRIMEWPGGATRTLTEAWDRSPGSIAWSKDGRQLFVNADNVGQRSLFSVDAGSGAARVVHEQGTVSSIAVADDRIVFGLDDLKSPLELHVIDPDGTEFSAITHINAEKTAAARMGDFEQFSFEGWNGETVHGFVVKPVDFDSSKKYPVAFLIHGGPQGSFGNHFHYRWNPQAYTGAGYADVMIDFHGSTGYGQAFYDSIRGDWGGKPLVDLQKGLAAALERYPWMDGDHVSALGASFGGYMINWIAGNWPDRFKCLVNHDGNLDERTAYFMTEELWFPEWDHMGTPWTNPKSYEQHNPIRFVGNWKTPMFVIHGGHDFRVVETEGMATFTALQRRGIPSQFLYFPDENHWVLKPANSIQWHDMVIAWLDRWTK